MSTTQTSVPAESTESALHDAFSQSHNAVQWLARIVRSFRRVNAGDDIALRWDNERDAFVTDVFADGLAMELRLPELTLQFLENGTPVKHELEMAGRSPAQVEAWILVELLHRGVDGSRFSNDLPYEIPHAMTGDSVEYSPDFREGELKEILGWFTAAANILKKLDENAAKGADLSSGLVLRTKSFSLETSVPLHGETGTSPSDRQIRIGFFPLRTGTVAPHYRIWRSEPSAEASNICEIINVSGMTADQIAGPQIVKKITESIAKLQKLAAH